MNDQLAALAATQGGAFTRAQARYCGYSDGAIRGMRRREWVDVARGVYVHHALLGTLPVGSRELHVLHASARILGSELDLVASHRTAAVVHGLPLLGPVPVVPQVTQIGRAHV